MNYYVCGLVGLGIGLVGLIFCQKKQRVNPIMQQVAYVFGLIMIVSFGFVLYGRLGGGEQASIRENEMLFLYSRSAVAGQCAKSAAPGKKVLFVTSPKWDAEPSMKEQVLAQVEAFKKFYGSNDVVIDTITVPADFDENGSAIEDVMTVKEFKALFDKHPGIGVVVTDIGLPDRISSLLSKKDAPVVFLLNQGRIDGKVIKALFKKGKIIGMISFKSKADYEAPADEDDLIASFKIRYELVDSKNYEKHEL